MSRWQHQSHLPLTMSEHLPQCYLDENCVSTSSLNKTTPEPFTTNSEWISSPMPHTGFISILSLVHKATPGPFTTNREWKLSLMRLISSLNRIGIIQKTLVCTSLSILSSIFERSPDFFWSHRQNAWGLYNHPSLLVREKIVSLISHSFSEWSGRMYGLVLHKYILIEASNILGQAFLSYPIPDMKCKWMK